MRGEDVNRLRIHKRLNLSQQIPNNVTDEVVRELWGALALGTSQKASGVTLVMDFHQSKE